MTETKPPARRIRPPTESGARAGDDRARATKLPRDLLERAGNRLRVASLMCALAFAVSFPVMNLAPSATAGSLGVANAVAAVSVIVSLGVYLLARSRIDPGRLIDLGLVYEVVVGFGIGFAETFATFDPGATVRGVSWLCMWIALFPLVVPTTPGKTLLAALATATMGPIAISLAIALGAPSPDSVTFLFLVLPNYFAAGLAVVFSRILYRLGADVTRAREMGSYEAVQLLGRGGMGEVWRARHRTLARPAAIKLVSAKALAGRLDTDVSTLRRRFEREARATAILTSPHTIQIFDFGITEDGTLYYVMELLDGVDLETLVEQHGPVPPERAVHFLLQACESLAEAHDGGLIHRDVKPANMYVCKLGTLHDRMKVLDFGLVADRSDFKGEKTRLTAEGMVTGTPAYMAPEMATAEREIDQRADVYSLGCVGYWLLTGKLVFEGSPLQVLYGHVEKPPTPPSERASQPIPAPLERLVLDCLQKEPEARPGDMHVVARRLRECGLPPWTVEQADRWWREHPRASPAAVVPEGQPDTVHPMRSDVDASVP